MASSLFEMSAVPLQTALAFPEPLTEKYRPLRIADFVGLEKAKKICGRLIQQPMPMNLFFIGNSGTGKSTLARAMAEEMPAELHHVPSRECDIQTVRDLVKQCYYVPRLREDWTRPSKMHIVLCDEADSMSRAAQDAFLSVLDGTSRPPNTIFVFTANATDNLEARFMSRCTVLEFSSYGIATAAAELLARIWDNETDNPTERPNFARLVKESNNNVREALNKLQVEIMMQ
jgi:replication-associated recombination protein RarA